MASCRRQLVILLGILAFCIATAHAFAPVEERADLAITRPGAERPPVWRQEGLRAEQHPEAALFEARAGSGWTYSWNAVNGTPHAVYGPGVDLSTGFLSGEAQAEDAARRFVDQHRDLLKVDPAQMKLVSVVNGLGKWGVIFQQEHDGIPVEDSFLRLLMTESGRLYYFGSDWHPAIGIATRPLLTVAEAGQFASRDVGFVAGRDLDEGGELLILPVPEGEGMGYRLVWRVRHRVEEPFAIWVSHVDAATGEVVWRYDDVCYANVVGTTAGDVEDYGYCYGEQDRRLPNMRVAVTGGNSGYSDLQGNYEITHSGTAPVTVTAQLDGRWINVNDQLDGDGTFTGTATPGVAFEIRWTDGWENDAARAIYLHGNRIHDAAKQYDPSWTSPDYRMSATANIASTCNAYWDGSTINFYRAGGGCGNTGQMGDVIYHEYAHGMTQWIYGNNPSDVGEGNSDVAALLLDGNSICGEGFYLNQCASGIRDADNTLRYPDDYQSGQIHFNGQIISGFWWDAREILLPIYGVDGTRDILWMNWHMGRRTLRPTSMPDQIQTAFLMDDDDGNLSNGTPHYYAFCPAATNHGFTPPGPAPVVTITHTPPHNKVFDGLPVALVATITSTVGPIDPATVKGNYAVNGGSSSTVALIPTGNPNEFAGTIPSFPVGSTVEYSIIARDIFGNGGAHPPNYCSPATPRGAERYYVVTILDELEAISGWTVGAPGDNATTGVWERVDPRGTAAQPEDDQTPAPGVNAFVTGQCAPGCGLGDSDVDGGTTTLLSPVYDLSSSTTAKAIYYRWYSNDQGATPGTDYWVVDASNDGGASWANVENTNVSAAIWTPIEVDLNVLFGTTPETVKFRFVASDLNDGSLVEAAVDEFMVMVDYATDAPESSAMAGGPRFALFPGRPNPFDSATELGFEIPAPASVTLKIHDTGGRLVRTLAAGSFQGGPHSVTWDGRDASGRELAAGIYYVRILTPGFSASRKVVLQK